MHRSKPLGLIGAGSVARSSLRRLPVFRERLGPVKSTSLRIARRIVNTLGTGHAVDDFEALTPCSMILVSVPDSALEGTLRDLAGARLDLKNRVIIVCDTFTEPPTLALLARRGAKVAGMLNLFGRFVLEGETAAVRCFKRELLTPASRAIILSRGARNDFLAGLSVAASTAQVAGDAGARLRAAGLAPGESRLLVERTASAALHAWSRAGQKAVDAFEREHAAKKPRLSRRD